MDLLFLFSSLACLVGIVIVTWLHNQHHLDIVVPPHLTASQTPLISVIVPARNEARNIRRCVESLLVQTYPSMELIVLDDRSTDETSEILATFTDKRLRTLHGQELPEGWAGKPHALWQATQVARGEWLCFIDADTFVAPEALAAVHAKALEIGADLFTIMTAQELKSFWERVIQPLVFTALSVGFSPRKVNNPSRKDAIANGQFILIRRSVYDEVGGHGALKNSIVEDRDLAALVKQSGSRLVIADGRKVATTRMYTSLPEIWEGWTKNIFLGLKGSPALSILGAFGATLSVIAALVLPLWMMGGLIAWYLGYSPGWVVAFQAAILWSYLIIWRTVVLKTMGVSHWYAMTVPLGAGIFAAMMVSSAWKIISRRGVTWKGRRYFN